MSTSIALHIENLSLSYARKTVLENFSLQLQNGDIGCLLGASGCGKTSVLRAIAGFETPSQGQISIHGNCVFSDRDNLAPEKRLVGMVFQDYALFPHLTVQDNIGFGLHAFSAAEIQTRCAELLALVGLHGLEKNYPHQLSGGQQQRVALARALAPKPTLLLLDEPFSNLDVELRERLGHEVRNILKQTGTTALLVTHDQHEAFAIADKVGVMNEGRILQWDTPYDLYHQPTDRFVADFIGEGVFLPAKMREGQCLEFALGTVCRTDATRYDIGTELAVLIRPDDIQHIDASETKAIVRGKAFRGAEFLYTLELPTGEKLLSLVPSHHNHAIGEAIGISLELDHLIAFRR
jgi:iron(III) transport system ATP-binding protein